MIGIFWVYKNTVFGKAIAVCEGEESTPGIVDSPDNHSDFWSADKDYRRQFPDLRFCEYLEVPRGRVLYSNKDCQAIIYMDKVLFADPIKKLIVDFFCLNAVMISWRTDSHYTTSSDEISRLLE